MTLYDTDGTTVLGTATATGGNWRSPPRSAGRHTSPPSDRRGRQCQRRPRPAVSPSTLPRPAPTAPDLVAASDSAGSSNTDNLTNNATPTVSGTAEAAAPRDPVRHRTASPCWVPPRPTDGQLVITSSRSSGQGAHTLKAKITDVAGNTSALSSGLIITIDTRAAPTWTWTATLATPVPTTSPTTPRRRW